MNNYTFDNGRSKVDVPEVVQKKIIVDYFRTTHYWSVGILSFLIGFLLGLVV